MVPKESGFNQSKTSCALCVRTLCRFPGSPAMARYIVKLYKGSISIITETQFASKVWLRNNQTGRNVYMWMQQ